MLVGNSFPLSLVRRSVRIDMVTIAEFRDFAKGAVIHSFWGHQNTLELVNRYLEADLTPREPRISLSLNEEGCPMLNGRTFQECWVVSPRFAAGFRPALGKEVEVDEIEDWQLLRIRWGSAE